jgi:hypothetical protein
LRAYGEALSSFRRLVASPMSGRASV